MIQLDSLLLQYSARIATGRLKEKTQDYWSIYRFSIESLSRKRGVFDLVWGPACDLYILTKMAEGEKSPDVKDGPTAEAASDLPAATATSNSTSEEEDLEALLVHIKGIKFQNPEFGTKRIHKEIQQLGGKFENLAYRKFYKIMKKNGLLRSQLEEDNQKAGVLRLFTVGKDGDQLPTPVPDVEEQEWVPIELDVPCLSDARHQATISHTLDSQVQKLASSTDNKGEIFKIQSAGGVTDPTPMLMYNQTKRKKTYIQPNRPGHSEIRKMIAENGRQGVDAAGGGSKQYFWGKQTKKIGKKFVLINIKELAPWQEW